MFVVVKPCCWFSLCKKHQTVNHEWIMGATSNPSPPSILSLCQLLIFNSQNICSRLYVTPLTAVFPIPLFFASPERSSIDCVTFDSLSGEDMRKIGPKWGFRMNQPLNMRAQPCAMWHRNSATWIRKFNHETCAHSRGTICESPLA